ncbi:uncharacterized protein LOC142240171 [Haematobia irritans]|uniref:uncharacterized protein LOC142240171 n=1 Tax=Haematobia irritans TaxID=7368 RepID=UPI003F4F7DB5
MVARTRLIVANETHENHPHTALYGKQLESLIKPKLRQAIYIRGEPSDRRHGFRSGKSMMGAPRDVMDVALDTRRVSHHSRPVVLLTALDVKNYFNSLKWMDVLQALAHNLENPVYFMRIIRSYLKGRILIYNTDG